MAGDPNLYDELERAIAQERAALPSSGDATDLSTWSEAEQEAQAALVRDHAAVEAHRYRGIQTVAGHEPEVCGTCREPRPCTTARELARAYGVDGDGGGQSSSDADGMSRAAMEGDRVGQCACGVSNRQTHLRISRPGEEPERWMRSKFECDFARPGPHFRIP
jgi:hypothetical protein